MTTGSNQAAPDGGGFSLPVLILGNGISRVQFDKRIRAFDGEIWGCNYVYIEYGEKLTRLTGHRDVLQKAIEYRDEHGLDFEIWSGHLGRNRIENTETFSCPREFLKDSGTTLVAQALHEGRRRVLVCGFDLGGPDILSLGLEKENKVSWVNRWRTLARVYDNLSAVEFIGFDHKPYILSKRPADLYWRQLQRGRAHIDDPGYLETYRLLYGDRIRGPKEDRMVRVKYISGPRVGWETQYKESVAQILANRGEIEILGSIEEEGSVIETPKKKPAKKKTAQRDEASEDDGK